MSTLVARFFHYNVSFVRAYTPCESVRATMMPLSMPSSRSVTKCAKFAMEINARNRYFLSWWPHCFSSATWFSICNRQHAPSIICLAVSKSLLRYRKPAHRLSAMIGTTCVTWLSILSWIWSCRFTSPLHVPHLVDGISHLVLRASAWRIRKVYKKSSSTRLATDVFHTPEFWFWKWTEVRARYLAFTINLKGIGNDGLSCHRSAS